MNKLKEKFLLFIDDIDLINDIPNKEWGLRNANKCVEIADEFAIEFSLWKDENTLRVDLNGYKAFGDTENDKPHTLQELLQIYKKEKGW